MRGSSQTERKNAPSRSDTAVVVSASTRPKVTLKMARVKKT